MDLFKNKRLEITLLVLFLAFRAGFSQNSLDYYLKAAHENNPTIKESLALTEKATIQENIIKAKFQGSKVFATSDINYSPLIPNKDDPKAIGYDVAVTDGGLYSGLLNIQQPVFNRSTHEILRQQAKIAGETGADKAKLTLHQLEKEVIELYKNELQTGELQIINYLNIVKSYTSAQHDLTISETNKMLIINENNYYNYGYYIGLFVSGYQVRYSRTSSFDW